MELVYLMKIYRKRWKGQIGKRGKGHRSILIDLIEGEGGGKFAEIGVERGKTCKTLLRYCGDIITEYWAIDPWTIVTSGKRQDWSQERWDNTYSGVLKLMDDYPQLRVLRMPSVKGAVLAKYEGLKFDIVFIDGDHSYEMVRADILCWKSLVRKGGLLTGHDYSSRYVEVVRAVDELLGKDNIMKLPGKMWFYRVEN